MLEIVVRGCGTCVDDMIRQVSSIIDNLRNEESLSEESIRPVYELRATLKSMQHFLPRDLPIRQKIPEQQRKTEERILGAEEDDPNDPDFEVKKALSEPSFYR